MGTQFFWVEDDIVERAILICQIFDNCRRTDIGLMTLWSCGFDVPPGKVKKIWLRRYRKEKRTKPAPRDHGLAEADKFWEFAERFGSKFASEHKRQEYSAQIIFVNYMLGTFGSQEYKHDKDELDTLVEATKTLIGISNVPKTGGRLITPQFVQQAFELLRASSSIDAARKQVRTAKSDELALAQNYLRAFGRFVRALVISTGQHNAESLVRQLRPHMAAHFGPPIARFFLRLIQCGQESRLIRSARIIDGIVADFLSNADLGANRGSRPAQLPSKEKASEWDQLINIWKDLDVRSLYGI